MPGSHGSRDEPRVGVHGGISSVRYGGSDVGVAVGVGVGAGVGVAVGMGVAVGVAAGVGVDVGAGVGVAWAHAASASMRKVSGRMTNVRKVYLPSGMTEATCTGTAPV